MVSGSVKGVAVRGFDSRPDHEADNQVMASEAKMQVVDTLERQRKLRAIRLQSDALFY